MESKKRPPPTAEPEDVNVCSTTTIATTTTLASTTTPHPPITPSTTTAIAAITTSAAASANVTSSLTSTATVSTTPITTITTTSATVASVNTSTTTASSSSAPIATMVTPITTTTAITNNMIANNASGAQRLKKKPKRDEPLQKEDIEEATGGQSTSKAAQYEAVFASSFPNQRPTPALVKAEWEKKNAELKKLKKQVSDLKLHESALVMRLSTKEQEIHRLQTELQDMKLSVTRSHKEMREIMLDRVVNMLFQRMKDQLKETKQKLRQAQEDIEANTFTRESASGRMMLNRLRILQKENADLGVQIAEGDTNKLIIENSNQKQNIEELRKYLSESHEWYSQLREELDRHLEKW